MLGLHRLGLVWKSLGDETLALGPQDSRLAGVHKVKTQCIFFFFFHSPLSVLSQKLGGFSLQAACGQGLWFGEQVSLILHS
jgi:hypothetical protein